MVNCLSCKLSFDSLIDLKAHLKQDFHLYNAKRKVAGLHHVTEADFLARLENLQGGKEAKKSDHISSRDVVTETKGVRVISKNAAPAFRKLVFSYQDLDFLQKECGFECSEFYGTPNEEGYVVPKDQTDGTLFTPMTSFLDGQVFGSRDDLLRNYEVKHSFYIPDQEYCPQLDELLLFLAAKVHLLNQCLYCSATFQSPTAALNHMYDSRHARIPLNDEGLEEISQFYDFRESIREMLNQDEVIECEGEADFDACMAHFGLKPCTIDADGDLRLPNGNTLAHRDLAYVYRQQKSHLSTLKPEQKMVLKNSSGELARAQNLGVTIRSRTQKVQDKQERRIMRFQVGKDIRLGVANNTRKRFIPSADMSHLFLR